MIILVFFDNDLNEQRDSKSKAYGIFADDEIDEVYKTMVFFDEDLETISNNTKDDDFKTSDKEKEDFGFFDEMPKLLLIQLWKQMIYKKTKTQKATEEKENSTKKTKTKR